MTEPTAIKDVSIINAHTLDSVIMNTINTAKMRWNENEKNDFFDKLSIISNDNLRLIGYFWANGEQNKKSSDPSERVIILVHGFMDSGAGMGYLAEEYHKKNWNVLSIDLRCHGESDGVKSTMGVREAEDISLWIDLLISKYHVTEIFLHGVSMGASAVLLYLANCKKNCTLVKGVIADSSYAEYCEVFYRVVKSAIRNSFISWSILKGTSFASVLFSGVPFGLIRPENAIERNLVPILFFHGEKDVLVPLQNIENMRRNVLKTGNKFVIVPGAPHIGAYFYEPQTYMDTIVSFMQKSMIEKIG